MSNGYIDKRRSDILNPHNIGGWRKSENSVSKRDFSNDERYEQYRRLFEIQDRLQATNRFEFIGLPPELDSNLIERIIYYRGKGCLFKYNDKFYFTPYALNGTIDLYGRFVDVTPLTFMGSVVHDEKTGKSEMGDQVWIPDLKRKVKYRVDQEIGGTYDDGMTVEPAVLLFDAGLGLNQSPIPRFMDNQVFHKEKAQIMVLIRKNLVNSVKQFVIVVKDEAQIEAYEEAWKEISEELVGKDLDITFVKSPMEIKELKGTEQIKAEEYWTSFDALDNLRQTLMGIVNNGVVVKKERMIVGEQAVNTADNSLILNDAMYQRKLFCMLVNSVEEWGLDIDVVDTQNEAGAEVDQNDDSYKMTDDSKGEGDSNGTND